MIDRENAQLGVLGIVLAWIGVTVDATHSVLRLVLSIMNRRGARSSREIVFRSVFSVISVVAVRRCR